MPVKKVAAGKLRRYANLKWYQHFKHIFISYIPNVFDMFKFCVGTLQSFFKILFFRPDVVFVKGGYVGLPVGLAASFLKKPIVLHDSDAVPGLTNRILGKYAVKIGLGMPQDNNSYDKSKTEYVGIPISDNFKKISDEEKTSLRKKYTDDSELPIILVMGGSQGSRVINQEIINSYPKLKGLAEVFLITGSDNYEYVQNEVDKHKRDYLGLRLLSFVSGDEIFELIGVSDIVVTRAGATTIAELGAEEKATVIIPSPYLSSDHQSKNADLLKEASAAVVINQDELEEKFVPEIKNLISDSKLRQKLGKNLGKFSSENAAEKMANIIIKVGRDEKK